MQVTDDLVTEVALACPLRRLGIANCSAVTDRGIRGVAIGAPQLTALIADDVGRLSDAALVALSESCKDIQAIRPSTSDALRMPDASPSDYTLDVSQLQTCM